METASRMKEESGDEGEEVGCLVLVGDLLGKVNRKIKRKARGGP